MDEGTPRWRRLVALDDAGRELDAFDLDDPFLARAAAALGWELQVARASRASGAAFDRLRAERGLRVHLGCGEDVRAGWVNVDLPWLDARAESLDGELLVFDLRRGLPLADRSCGLIYASHLLSVLEYGDAATLLADCRRCLEPSGTLRLALGDYAPDLWAYLSGDREHFERFDRLLGEDEELVSGLPAELRGRTLADYLNHGLYEYGRLRTFFDRENLRALLEHVGFGDVRETGFRDDVDPGWPLRRDYSFYVEATP